jgi:hypothetical protein
MAVPDTTTFSLQDVVDEINPTTDDLQDCVNDAVSAKYDSNYIGDRDRLSNFRNYGSTGHSFNTKGELTPLAACGNTPDGTFWTNMEEAGLAIGDVLYTSSTLATVLNGADGNFKHSNGNVYKIGTSGTIDGIYTGCP